MASGVGLLRVHVDGDDARRIEEARGLHHVHADAADAEHHHRVARAHRHHVGRDAVPGRHRAPDERGLRRREPGGRHHLLGPHDRGARERRHVGVGAHGSPRQVNGRGVRRERVGALAGTPGGAGATPTARDRGRDHHLVARSRPRRRRPHRVDHARGLVAEHDGRRDRAGAVEDVEVAVTDARRQHAHPDLTGRGIAHVHVVDHAQALTVEHRGTRGQHARSLRSYVEVGRGFGGHGKKLLVRSTYSR